MSVSDGPIECWCVRDHNKQISADNAHVADLRHLTLETKLIAAQ